MGMNAANNKLKKIGRWVVRVKSLSKALANADLWCTLKVGYVFKSIN